MTPLLEAAGVPWVAPDLPSVALASQHGGLAADVALVEATLDSLEGDDRAVLLGHSRGGRVISEAGAHARVGHLVYLTAVIPADDEPRLMPPAGEPLPDGTTLPSDGAPGRFYSDCSEEIVSWATARIRPQSPRSLEVASPRRAWTLKPSTYVVCAADRSLDPERQRLMARHANSVVEWSTGHSPFLSRPDLVASLLVELARS